MPPAWGWLAIDPYTLPTTPQPEVPSGFTAHRIAPSYNNTARFLLLHHLVLVAINAHFAVADNKGVDFCDVAHRTRSQYAIQPSCECVRVLFEDLQR